MEQATLRNGGIERILELLVGQRARRMDLVVPAARLRSEHGVLAVEALEFAELTETGVSPGRRFFEPNTVALEGLAEKLGIPTAYLRRLHAQRKDLFDANVNGWLHGDGFDAGPDARSFLLRAFVSDVEGETGIGRAFLSDKFKAYDNLDVLTVALEVIGEADPEAKVITSDLSDRRMLVRVLSPNVSVPAPNLLAGYRSPFDGPGGARRAGDMVNMRSSFENLRRQFGDHHFFLPGDVQVHGGVALGNSEVGDGALTISPFIYLPICSNGSTLIRYTMRKTHLGAKMEEGTIDWSEQTQRLNMDLIASQTRDAVTQFMTAGFLEGVVREIDQKAGVVLSAPMETVVNVTKSLGVSEDRIQGVLDHFMRGGQLTAGGVLNAVTSFAQCIEDAEEAHAFEALGLQALDLAVAAA